MKVRKITRKTPCESCKHTLKRAAAGSGTRYIYCNGCGEWDVTAEGKASRPVGWQGNYARVF